MAKIILDTNFLMIPAQFNVDIFSEIHRICDFKYELYIIDKTIDELRVEATNNAKEITRIVDEGSQRVAKALETYLQKTATRQNI